MTSESEHMRFIIILALLLVPVPPWTAYATTPVDELQLMTMRELYEKVVSFCQLKEIYVGTPQYDGMMTEVNNIWRVARQKNKGTFPKWALRQQQAMKEGKPEHCSSPEFK